MRHWTIEERQRQAELIRTWQPWQKATGARTDAGRERSKMNALKHGTYAADSRLLWQELRRFMRECGEVLA